MRDIWRDQAINELELYNARMQALHSISDQIAELEASLTSIRSPSAGSVSVKGGGGSYDEKYLNSFVKCDLLKANLEETRKAVNRVYNAMCVLADDEAKLLERRYIVQEKKAVLNIAKEKDVDPRTVNRDINDALVKFAVALYGNK